jgi:hypothetical protein
MIAQLFMEGKTFEDLFFTQDHYLRKWDSEHDGHRSDAVANHPDIGHYLVVSGVNGHRSFHVSPKPELVSWIAKEMLVIERDRKYFEVVERVDGSALVIVKHDQILGSRWLTIVPTASLPWSTQEAIS